MSLNNDFKNDTKLYSCILLSGGMSRRMGQDKGSMIIQDKPMVFHILNKLNHQINDCVIVLNDSQRIANYEELLNQYSEDTIYNEFDYKISFVEDEIKDKGPLSGIMTGLKNIETEYAIVLPCDSPFVNGEYFTNMFGLIESESLPEAIIPFHTSLNHEKDIIDDDIISMDFKEMSIEDKIKMSEPLHSIYSESTLDNIYSLLENDDLFVKSFIRSINKSHFVLIDDIDIKEINFKNLNRKEDLKLLDLL